MHKEHYMFTVTHGSVEITKFITNLVRVFARRSKSKQTYINYIVQNCHINI